MNNIDSVVELVLPRICFFAFALHNFLLGKKTFSLQALPQFLKVCSFASNIVKPVT